MVCVVGRDWGRIALRFLLQSLLRDAVNNVKGFGTPDKHAQSHEWISISASIGLLGQKMGWLCVPPNQTSFPFRWCLSVRPHNDRLPDSSSGIYQPLKCDKQNLGISGPCRPNDAADKTSIRSEYNNRWCMASSGSNILLRCFPLNRR